MATVEDRERILLVALQTPPKRLILYGDDDLLQSSIPMQSAIAELVDFFVEDNYDLPGVLGPAPIAEAFQEHWIRKTRSESAIFMSQRVYVLREVLYEPDVDGRLRLAVPEDINRVKRWYMSFSESHRGRIGLTEAVSSLLSNPMSLFMIRSIQEVGSERI